MHLKTGVCARLTFPRHTASTPSRAALHWPRECQLTADFSEPQWNRHSLWFCRRQRGQEGSAQRAVACGSPQEGRAGVHGRAERCKRECIPDRSAVAALLEPRRQLAVQGQAPSGGRTSRGLHLCHLVGVGDKGVKSGNVRFYTCLILGLASRDVVRRRLRKDGATPLVWFSHVL